MDKKNDPPDEIVILRHNGRYIDTIDNLASEIARDAFFERHFDRILYGGDLKYAPARHLVKPLLIPPKTKIPKIKFVDIDGTLIQQQEWDRRVELSRLIRELTKRGDIYG